VDLFFVPSNLRLNNKTKHVVTLVNDGQQSGSIPLASTIPPQVYTRPQRNNIRAPKMKLSNNFKRFLRVFFAVCIFLCTAIPRNDFFVVVKGESMEPTLKNNQLVLAAKEINPLFIDDIVVIKMNNESIVKRITAMQGDKYVENLNGDRSYTLVPDWLLLKGNRTKIFLKEIPENYYFVEGDNRDASFDSKNFGLIHKSQIIGKCLL